MSCRFSRWRGERHDISTPEREDAFVAMVRREMHPKADLASVPVFEEEVPPWLDRPEAIAEERSQAKAWLAVVRSLNVMPVVTRSGGE